MYRFAAIGAFSGHLDQSHFPQLQALGHTVTAVYDISSDPAKLQKVLNRFPNAAFCSSVAELLSRTDIDAVLIASYDEMHPEHLAQVIARGLPVWVEKPLAVTAAGMRSVRDSFAKAKRAGIPVMSCHPRQDTQNRDLPYGWVNTQLARLRRQFGELIHVGLDFAYPAPRGGWKADGRSLAGDHATHELLAIRDWSGSKEKIRALLVHDSPDHYSMVGAIGKMSFSCVGTRLEEPGLELYPETIDLRFKKGRQGVDTGTGKLLAKIHGSWSEYGNKIRPLTGKAAYDDVFMAGARRFIAVLEKRVPPPYDELLEINSAMIELLEHGKVGC